MEKQSTFIASAALNARGGLLEVRHEFPGFFEPTRHNLCPGEQMVFVV